MNFGMRNSRSPTSNSLTQAHLVAQFREHRFSTPYATTLPGTQGPYRGTCTSVYAYVSPLHGQKRGPAFPKVCNSSPQSNYFVLPIPRNIVKHHLTWARNTLGSLGRQDQCLANGHLFSRKRVPKYQKYQKHVGSQTKSDSTG